jgi:hypothetical protein
MVLSQLAVLKHVNITVTLTTTVDCLVVSLNELHRPS